MQQQRLFVVAPDTITFTATREGSPYWHLVVADRTSGEPWDDSRATHYDHLTSAELADVVDVELFARLGLG